jgi:16S rRNA (uracil1498-N3)-methyltransferase
MTERFFVDPPVSGETETVWLEAAESRHLAKVMRAKLGDEVTLFDGGGCEFAARIVEIDRNRVELRIVSRKAIDRELPIPITLGVALPKGDRQRWLVEKCVELGVGRLVPLKTTRSVAQPSDQALLRLSRFVVEASKQCGRNRLMLIGPATDFGQFVRFAEPRGGRWIADPSGQPIATGHWTGGELCVAIGPEGGFTADELGLAHDHQWQCLNLGPRILRVETAAAAVTAIASTMFG